MGQCSFVRNDWSVVVATISLKISIKNLGEKEAEAGGSGPVQFCAE